MSGEKARSGRSPEHDGFSELALGWALHALEPEDEALLLGHLPDCRRCERDVAAATEVMAAMARELPAAHPPAGLRGALLAEVGATDQVPVTDVLLPELLPPPLVELAPEPCARHSTAIPAAAPVPSRHGVSRLPRHRAAAGWHWWRRMAPSGLVAAAVAIIIGLGVWNVSLTAARDGAQATADTESQALGALLSPGRLTMTALADSHGRRMATVVVRGSRLQVVSQALPVDDTKIETYVLWGVRGSVPTALGTFDVKLPRTDLRSVGSAQAGRAVFAAYEISREAGRQAPPTPTEIVATGQVSS